jgi:nicotinate phosphoribosyltransferase
MKPKTHLQQYATSSLGLLTDLYQLTMAYGYWKTGQYRQRAAFHLFFRSAPFGGHYAIAAGLELAIDYLQRLRFSAEEVQYLGSLTGNDGQPLFDESFLNYLQRLKFSGEIDAVPEGTPVFAHQPLLRIEGSIIECQIAETALLTLLNFSTLIATKAARVVQAAQGDQVLEFGLRRAQGIDGGLTATRAAYIGGCHATSNLLAGKLYHIPVKGTHAHSWVLCFDSELEAFEQYARALPNNAIFLVDTYDTIEGIRHAIAAGRQLRQRGYEMAGIRLDSGDLSKLSQAARQMLDEAGFPQAAIVASNDLDEYQIARLKAEGAPIAIWGVGTRLVTAYDQPALGGVYKLSAIQREDGAWEDRIKLSETEAKVSNPGLLQVLRSFDAQGHPNGDAISDIRDADAPDRVWDESRKAWVAIRSARRAELLQPVFRAGQLVYAPPPLAVVRQHSLEQQALFASLDLAQYPHGLSPQVWGRKQALRAAYEKILGPAC